MITISAFKWVPDFAQGQVRDLRARWALEEAGLPYRSRLLEQGDQDKPDYRALQPFGQVPILEEDGVVLFESGAIVLYIGERSETLLPKDAGARARATQWLIAALNSIEPFVMNVAAIDLFYAKEEWAKLRRPGAVEFVQRRLSALSGSLGHKPYLDGDRFTAGDLMMTTVLANPQAYRHRHKRWAPRSLCRTLHRAACLQARVQCADWRFQTSCMTGMIFAVTKSKRSRGVTRHNQNDGTSCPIHMDHRKLRAFVGIQRMSHLRISRLPQTSPLLPHFSREAALNGTGVPKAAGLGVAGAPCQSIELTP